MAKRQDIIIETARQRTSSIRIAIEKNRALKNTEKSWLQKQKKAFQRNPSNFDKEKLELLDSLIPFLGFDWRESSSHLWKTQKKNVTDIHYALKEGKPLAEKLTNWLYQQQKVYNKDPDALDEKLIALLDSLNPVLSGGWRNFSLRDEHTRMMLRKLSSALKSKRKPEKKVANWFKAQRISYRKNPDRFKKSTKEKLDTLIPLLGYDWKLSQEKHKTTPFETKVSIIKKKLEKKRNLNNKEKSWLEHFRRQYHKKPNVYARERIELLNTLNLFLTIPWQEYLKEKPKQYKHFKDWVCEIKDQGLPYPLLSKAQKEYLKAQRYRYSKNKKKYPMAQLSALNSLNEILERDWKKTSVKRKKRVSFPQVIKRIKTKLQNNQVLSKDEKRILSRYRSRYHKGTVSPENIERLDTLNSLLGYDWKDPSRLRKKSKTFKERVEDIKQCLERNIELSQTQKKWLDYHRSSYLKSPDNYPVDKLFILDTLNPLLQRDWKAKIMNVKEKISFEESVIKIRRRLITAKELTKSQMAWFSLQRLYYKRNDLKMTENKIKSLDSLNFLLGYDWKIYKRER